MTIPGQEVLEEVLEEEIVEEVQEENEEESQPDEFSFDIQYDKEAVTIKSEDELRALAQKGMNYDKIQNNLEELKSNPLLNWANNYMKQVGYTDPNAFIAQVQKEQQQQKFNKEVQNYVDNGYGKDVAQELAKLKENNQELTTKYNEINQKTKQTQQYNDFLNWYDAKLQDGTFKESLDVKNIPSDIWAKVDTGMSIKEAYMEHALKNLRTTIEQEVISSKNKKANTSTGSIDPNSKSESAPLTDETIEKNAYNPKWLKDNWDAIEKSGYFKRNG